MARSLKAELNRIFDTFKKECFQIYSFKHDHKEFSKQLLDEYYPINEKFNKERSELIKTGAKTITIVIKESGRKIRLSRKEFKMLYSVMSDRIGIIEKYPKLINTMLFVYLNALFDAFFFDTIRMVISHRKEILRSSKHLTYEKALEFDNMSDLHSYILDSEINELSYISFKEQCDFLGDKFNIDINKCGVNVDEISEIVATRNLLVHNKGIVNRFYMDTVLDSQLYVGDERVISDKYFEESLDKVRSVAKFLLESFIQKFCTSKSLK